MLRDRLGEAFEGDARLTVVGDRLQPGDQAPAFTLDAIDANGVTFPVALADSAGRVRLLNVINSLDTPVCRVETRQWETLRATLPPNVQVYTISMDLPFAQARWQSAEHVAHQMLSDHRSAQFGQDYGVLLKEWRLLQRAVFVIDSDDHIVYTEYVADQMREPDYHAAIMAATQAAG